MTLRTRIAATGLAAVAAFTPGAPGAAVVVGAFGAATVVGVAVASEAQAAQGVIRNTCARNGLPLRTGNTLATLNSDLGCNTGRYANYVTAPGPFRIVNANTGVGTSYYGGSVVNIQGGNYYGYRL